MTLAEPNALRIAPDQVETRRPRIAIMGEFSAGKSTLMNLLLGEPALPVKVTATQLPPVWITHGEQEPFCIDLEGNETPVSFDDLSGIDPAEIQSIRVFHTADALEVCDLIDMPGISDPNMPSEVWERLLDEIDAVIWCTHATQAWRQSEDAVWAGFPEDIQKNSLLLVTRFDKIVAERDRARLLARVKAEVDGLFRGVFPISLTEAMAAEDDEERWQASGADAFANALIELTAALNAGPEPKRQQRQPAVDSMLRSVADPAVDAAPYRASQPGAPTAKPTLVALERKSPPAPQLPAEPRVMPQRVRTRAAASVRPARPPRDDAGDAGI